MYCSTTARPRWRAGCPIRLSGAPTTTKTDESATRTSHTRAAKVSKHPVDRQCWLGVMLGSVPRPSRARVRASFSCCSVALFAFESSELMQQKLSAVSRSSLVRVIMILISLMFTTSRLGAHVDCIVGRSAATYSCVHRSSRGF